MRLIEKHPHLAMVWLKAQENYEEFRQKFSPGKLFPEDDALLGKLYGRYDLCSKMIHSNIFSFGRHLVAERSATEFNLRFDYPAQFQRSRRATLLFILDTHFGVLQVFENVFNWLTTPQNGRFKEILSMENSVSTKRNGGHC